MQRFFTGRQDVLPIVSVCCRFLSLHVSRPLQSAIPSGNGSVTSNKSGFYGNKILLSTATAEDWRGGGKNLTRFLCRTSSTSAEVASKVTSEKQRPKTVLFPTLVAIVLARDMRYLYLWCTRQYYFLLYARSLSMSKLEAGLFFAVG